MNPKLSLSISAGLVGCPFRPRHFRCRQSSADVSRSQAAALSKWWLPRSRSPLPIRPWSRRRHSAWRSSGVDQRLVLTCDRTSCLWLWLARCRLAAFANHVPFKFGDARHHCEHEAAHFIGRVAPRVAKRSEAAAAVLEITDGVVQVTR
jgi:hypothetical protein